jgi:hypothetical protein
MGTRSCSCWIRELLTSRFTVATSVPLEKWHEAALCLRAHEFVQSGLVHYFCHNSTGIVSTSE